MQKHRNCEVPDVEAEGLRFGDWKNAPEESSHVLALFLSSSLSTLDDCQKQNMDLVDLQCEH